MKTVFVEYMGNSPRMRLYDFFLENDRTSWTERAIRYHAKIGYGTLKRELKIMLSLKIIKCYNKKYKLNKDGLITPYLYGIYNSILREVRTTSVKRSGEKA